MVSKQEASSFIRATFRTVWSLELLLFLKKNVDHAWSKPDLVVSLRGSELIVSQSIDSLVAAGVVSTDKVGAASYSPASADLGRLVEATEALYSTSPDAVRRMIIASTSGSASAFADAFRLRKD